MPAHYWSIDAYVMNPRMVGFVIYGLEDGYADLRIPLKGIDINGIPFDLNKFIKKLLLGSGQYVPKNAICTVSSDSLAYGGMAPADASLRSFQVNLMQFSAAPYSETEIMMNPVVIRSGSDPQRESRLHVIVHVLHSIDA